MTKYATLFGFGLFDEGNPKYKAYVDRFAKLVKKKGIDEVVLCGGHTNRDKPDKSEAGTIAEYLRPLVGQNVKIHVEDKSLTTEQNVSFAKQFISLGEGNQVFVVSESVRFFKTMWMVLDRWFGMSKEDINRFWFQIFFAIYANPKKKGTAIELKDIKGLLKYKNVKMVVDPFHKEYKSGMHTILSEVFEIESLQNKAVYDNVMEMTMRKFKLA